MHYRLRAIRGVPLGVVNFTSHFIVIQIFQILFSPSVSFYMQCMKKGRDELVDICPLSTAQIFAIKYLLFQKSTFTMKGASAEVAILSFFT